MIPGIPQIRMSRCVSGVTQLNAANAERHWEDSIGIIGNWRQRGPAYEIPFSCMRGKKIQNLVTAGRCVSADPVMLDQLRVIPACAVTGEAAGLAAAMSHDFIKLDIDNLQYRLTERGIPLHKEDIEKTFLNLD